MTNTVLYETINSLLGGYSYQQILGALAESCDERADAKRQSKATLARGNDFMRLAHVIDAAKLVAQKVQA